MPTELPIFQVDAFSSRLFGGNPAAVVPLDAWLEDATMQSIALENNLSETAFLAARGDDFDLRWFTPKLEVDLCGHATLASARVVFDHLRPGTSEVCFHTRSGELRVRARGSLLEMDLPAHPPEPCATSPALVAAVGGQPTEVLSSSLYDLVVYASEAEIRTLAPEASALMQLDAKAVIVTAPGEDVDFVSRFFAPRAGVYEDPTTGSAHCVSTPYWARRLGRPRLRARQISARVGDLECEDRGDRVSIAGEAVQYLEGRIRVE